MRILQVCHKVPYPAVDGGCLAMKQLSDSLIRKGIHVEVFALATHKHPFKNELKQNSYFIETNFSYCEIDTEIKPFRWIVNLLFSKLPYNAERFYSKGAAEALKNKIRENSYDAIILESIYSGVYLQDIYEVFNRHVYLRTHNIEHQLWSDKLKQTFNPIKRFLFHNIKSRLRKLENHIANKCTGIIAISKTDSDYFRTSTKYNRTIIHPFTFRIIKPPELPLTNPIKFYFIGAMDWEPNLKGIEWFLSEVWNHQAINSIAEFHLAGKNMPLELKTLNLPNFINHGEVPKAEDFIRDKQVLITPLFEGSGIRIKILEAMSKGKVVISTSKGIEGIPALHHKECIIANDSNEFLEAMTKVCLDNTILHQLSAGGFDFVKKNYSEEIMTDELVNFLRHKA
jgi:polysaccharide biosynthesis protein PslH